MASVDPLLRPRRSLLFVPASNPRALAKGRTVPADALILDLEDAVAPDGKPAARDAACAAVRSGAYGRRELVVRVNGTGTAWHTEDLRAACAAGPDAVLVPKVGSAEVVRRLADQLDELGASAATRLWAMLETPSAVLRAAEICAASDRLTAVVVGSNDLTKELAAEHVPGRQPLLTSLQLCVLAARATGRVVLDGVFNDLQDTDGFLAECRQGRELGFDGKTLIHPSQVAGANEVFSPSPQAVADARGVLEAWAGRTAGSGVVTHQGRMVEELHVESARRVLAAQESIEALADDQA